MYGGKVIEAAGGRGIERLYGGKSHRGCREVERGAEGVGR